MGTRVVDYYEFLQISPNADADTIHRVYRFLAARLHPDNRETGHAENFQLLKAAHDVLLDPKRRAEYDALRSSEAPRPLSSTVDFMDTLEGELNRRLAVLAVLYHRRRTNPNFPEVSLATIEERMGFPRDYLDFTLWYLQKKGYVFKADNAEYAMTVDGVDFVETQRTNMPTLSKLLTSRSGSPGADVARAQWDEAAVPSPNGSGANRQPAPDFAASSMHSTPGRAADQPVRKADRRVGAPDLRAIKVERRYSNRDRRVKSEGQRAND